MAGPNCIRLASAAELKLNQSFSPTPFEPPHSFYESTLHLPNTAIASILLSPSFLLFHQTHHRSRCTHYLLFDDLKSSRFALQSNHIRYVPFTMNHLLFPLLFAFLNPLISAQQLLPNNLPSCAQQCTVLQQGQTGCTPAGGAPVSNEAIYQSCFCQSALLTQLYSNNAVQLCSSCPANDMNTIQNWYKNYCGKGGAPIQGNGNGQNGNNGQQQQPPQTTTAKAPTTTPTSGTNRQGVTNSANQPQEPW